MPLFSALVSLTSCFYEKHPVRREWSHQLRSPNLGPKGCLVNCICFKGGICAISTHWDPRIRQFLVLMTCAATFPYHTGMKAWQQPAPLLPPSLLSSFLVKSRHASWSAPWHCPDRCHLASAEDHNIRDVCPGIPCMFALLFGTHLS